jgi:hypothetical protein
LPLRTQTTKPTPTTNSPDRLAEGGPDPFTVADRDADPQRSPHRERQPVRPPSSFLVTSWRRTGNLAARGIAHAVIDALPNAVGVL